MVDGNWQHIHHFLWTRCFILVRLIFTSNLQRVLVVIKNNTLVFKDFVENILGKVVLIWVNGTTYMCCWTKSILQGLDLGNNFQHRGYGFSQEIHQNWRNPLGWWHILIAVIVSIVIVLVLFLYTAKNVINPWKEPMICLRINFSPVHTQMKTILSEYLSVTGTCESNLDSHHWHYSFHLHCHWSGKILVEGRINFCSWLLKILLYYIKHLWTNTMAIVAMLLPSREAHEEMCLFQGHLCLLFRAGRNLPSSQRLLTNIGLHTSWFCLQWGIQDICDLKLNEKLLKPLMSSWCSNPCLNTCTFVWRR